MDLPFLLYLLEANDDAKKCFNPYSNGSSFFMSIDIEQQEVAFILNDKKYLYKVNLNILSKELWKTYYSPYWFKLYTEELNTLTYNINKGLVDNPKIVEQREEYRVKTKELKIWQEPGFAVLIAITLILGGYLIGVFL